MEKAFGLKSNKKQKMIEKRKVVGINGYFHILSIDETSILFNNLEEIFNRIFDLEIHNKKLRKKITKQGISNRTGLDYTTNQSDLSIKLDTHLGTLSPKDLLITGNN